MFRELIMRPLQFLFLFFYLVSADSSPRLEAIQIPLNPFLRQAQEAGKNSDTIWLPGSPNGEYVSRAELKMDPRNKSPKVEPGLTEIWQYHPGYYSTKVDMNDFTCSKYFGDVDSEYAACKVYMHGFTSTRNDNPLTPAAAQIVMDHMDKNTSLFVVDWSKGAQGPNYPEAVANTAVAAKEIARFLIELVKRGCIKLKFIHLIGFSLGAHVAGITGYEIHQACDGNVGRITGLDPAGPLYTKDKPLSERLDSSDADYVDAHHTCADYLGIWERCGHLDLYWFGGKPSQTFCNCDWTEYFAGASCSHNCVCTLHTELIKGNLAGLKAYPCVDEEVFYYNGTCWYYEGTDRNVGYGPTETDWPKGYFLVTYQS